MLLDKNTPRIRSIVNKVETISNEFRVFPMEVIAGDDSLRTTIKADQLEREMDAEIQRVEARDRARDRTHGRSAASDAQRRQREQSHTIMSASASMGVDDQQPPHLDHAQAHDYARRTEGSEQDYDKNEDVDARAHAGGCGAECDHGMRAKYGASYGGGTGAGEPGGHHRVRFADY